MKWLLTFTFTILISTTVVGQDILQAPVHLSLAQTTLREVLDAIEKQCEVRFAYHKNQIKPDQLVSIEVVNQSLSHTLTMLFTDRGITFQTSGRQVILNKVIPDHYTLSGYVIDKQSGEVLIGANIFESLHFQGVISNEHGFYSLTLPTGKHAVTASFVGYEDLVDTIDFDREMERNIALQAGASLMEIVVTGQTSGNRDPGFTTQEETGEQINKNDPGAYSSVLGENDIMKTAQLMPGVVAGIEGTSGLHIQGGSADQNLILLDDVPLYNVNHLFGFISIFNSKALNSAAIFKNHFPARYGGRLSSVFDIRMKNGDYHQYHGAISMGIISGNAFFEGPIKKGESSFIISTRRTWLDLIVATTQIADKEFKLNYNFYDINTKVNVRTSSRDRLILSFYGGNDRYIDKRIESPGLVNNIYQETKLRNGLSWGNQALSLRWNRTINAKWFANTTFFYGRFHYDYENFSRTDEETDNGNILQILEDIEIASKIKDYGIKSDLNFHHSPGHDLEMGIAYTLHHYVPGFLRNLTQFEDKETEVLIGAPEVTADEWAIYLEDHLQIGSKWQLNSGLRLNYTESDGTSFWLPQFRLQANFVPNQKWKLDLSYANMAQFVHQLTTIGIGLPTDLWVPSTNRINPATAHQLTLHAGYQDQHGFSLSASVFYKAMKNLITYTDGASFLNSTANWESRVDIGDGNGYGLTLAGEKNWAKTDFRMAYSLMWANRKFPNINDGNPFPYNYDRRHNFNLSFQHHWWKKNRKLKSLGLVWMINSGHLATIPEEWYLDKNGQIIPHNPKRNNYRLPWYHRLDITKSSRKETKRGNFRTFRWGAYNVYGRANIFNVYLAKEVTDGTYKIKGNSVFPVPIPFIQYEFEF